MAHTAVLYRSDAEYAAAVMDVAAADNAGKPGVVLAATGRHEQVVRDALSLTAAKVSFADIAELSRDPARLVAAVLSFADDHPGQQVCCVMEAAWPGRTGAELQELGRSEAVCTLALAERPVTMLCPYDGSELPADVLSRMELTHPAIIDGGQHRPGHGYLGAGRFPPECDEPLPSPPPDAATVTFRRDLATARAFAARHAQSSGLSSARVIDLVLAVGELAANTLRHSPDGGTVSAWTTADEVLLQVEDMGHITDPMAGYRRLPSDAAGGHGLWLVHQLCDLTEIRTSPLGTTIRLHMTLASQPPAPRKYD
jgi:anti-sigma regulatory factor (Ser/Thr protein kinase)